MLSWLLMPKKILIIIIAVSLFYPVLSAVNGFSMPLNGDTPSFRQACHMDGCNPNMPKCPLCPSWGSAGQYYCPMIQVYLPELASSFISFAQSSLSDQEVVRLIFRPPTFLT